MPQASPEKTELRRQALARRNVLAPDARMAASEALARHRVFAVGDRTVSAYHAIGSELDPAPLMLRLEEQGAKLALPVLLDQETMLFRRWDRSRALVPVGFGTLGPDAGLPEVVPDLILAPLAAFTPTGQRIGYGKGHYDRALSKLRVAGHGPVFVGLGFDDQEVAPFAVEAHDIALHAVLTPSGLRLFDGGRDVLAPFLQQESAANERR